MGFTLVGAGIARKAVVNGAAVDQAIPNNQVPYQQVTFNQTIYDTMSAFDTSDSSWVIPAGVTHVEFVGQAVWHYNTSGLRQLVIQRKSPQNVNPNVWEFFSPAPVHNQMAGTNTTSDFAVVSPGLIPVQAGERFALMPWQTSGTTVNISGGGGTMFAAKFYQLV